VKRLDDLKYVLPEYPRTPHLPWKPNVSLQDADIVLSEEACAEIFAAGRTESKLVSVQEKIDGANCGMSILDGEPVIRNRQHILRKGYHKDTPAKQQFASVWNWWYDHRDNFEFLQKHYGPVSVYGEWMVQQHGMKYDRLPDWFIAYDLYDYEEGRFYDWLAAQDRLITAGFSVVPVLHYGKIDNYQYLEKLANGPSLFTDAQREGIVIKVSDGKRQISRYKMVRQGFVQGALLGDELKRNLVNSV
jgi:hypothetical protein